jgi:dipeptidyl aminopeptidase/acylaminoacyl peptidase
MTPDDLIHLHTPSETRLSPNGSRAVFVVSTPNLEDDRYDRVIWIADDSGARQFTSGPGDSIPRWSPDGGRLAFARSVDGGKSQVAVMPVDGGEARVLTEFDHGVEAIEWSPDGNQLVVVAITYTDEWADLEDEERERKPRRISTIPFVFDNMGWTHDRKRHLWLVDPDGVADPSCLTPGDFDEAFPAWSPDGSKVAFISDRNPSRGLASGNDAWEVGVESGEVTRAAERGFWLRVSYRPDGALHLLGNTNPRYPVDAYLYRRETGGALTNLTGHLDRSSVSLAAGAAHLAWDGEDAITGHEDSGRFGLIRVEPTGQTSPLVDGERVVLAFDCGNGRIVHATKGWDSAGEVFSLNGGSETQLTALNTEDIGVIHPEQFTIESAGHELDVWVYLPEGDARVPLLLNVHGGPASQYGYGLFDEFQVYAGAGFGVVATNPRGSAGKGKTFVEAVKGDGWGTVDVEDLDSVVAEALDRFDRLDPTRMGVMGGSYGGFMSAWMIGLQDRWKSAVVERALLSWTSFSGTSDIGGVFPENYLGEEYPDSWEFLWEKSPLAIADRVTTPTLILHSENDFRCPIEQAEQYFTALLRNGTTTEMLRFPGEGHEMSRDGKPRHRKERFEAILDWHDRFLR